ncbi:uncharacterized protein BKA78DRAFT_324620 [Phyllosticta capitalensis]|uniref:uncharacterized protein n=1 Tax=Phyllosticta capitalensis TaxID=121624 RepID=UPI003130ECED
MRQTLDLEFSLACAVVAAAAAAAAAMVGWVFVLLLRHRGGGRGGLRKVCLCGLFSLSPLVSPRLTLCVRAQPCLPLIAPPSLPSAFLPTRCLAQRQTDRHCMRQMGRN